MALQILVMKAVIGIVTASNSPPVVFDFWVRGMSEKCETIQRKGFTLREFGLENFATALEAFDVTSQLFEYKH